MPSHATSSQISYIKTLGRSLGLTVEGDAEGLDHVLSVATFGRVSHWASLSVIEASQAIERLGREIDEYGTVVKFPLHPLDQDGYLGGNSFSEHQNALDDLNAHLERASSKPARDELTAVRKKILRIIELNPHSYESLQSYRNAVKRERELVAKEVAAQREL